MNIEYSILLANKYIYVFSFLRNACKTYSSLSMFKKTTRDALDPITIEETFEERENDATEDIIGRERIQKEEFAYNRQKKRRLIDENRCFFLFFFFLLSPPLVLSFSPSLLLILKRAFSLRIGAFEDLTIK